uniref:Uncharacterized protein n=1 Tax=Eutreptiella gymnastica TaxID=73025 RepID=A0A7S1IX35_9EUGL|mmetsp:Transcript_49225/g.87902  ORF Transcript_49225/g.87902 Transcript_49225/m.87902 type:complete len:359 (+) Transcript_49225:70-1146(+)
MATATCRGIKLRPALEQRWREDAERRYERQFWAKWVNDDSARALRSANRQQPSATDGVAEVSLLLQGEYFPKRTGWPAKRKPVQRDMIKHNKENAGKKRTPHKTWEPVLRERQRNASHLEGSSDMKQDETRYDVPFKATSEHRRQLQLSNHRKKAYLDGGSLDDPNTVSNSLCHVEGGGGFNTTSRVMFSPDPAAVPREAFYEAAAASMPKSKAPAEVAANEKPDRPSTPAGAPPRPASAAESMMSSIAASMDRSMGSSCRTPKSRPLSAAIEHARQQKKALHSSQPAAAADLAVEDIEVEEATDSKEVGTSGSAHRHVAMQKKADKKPMAMAPKPTRRALRAASAQARSPPCRRLEY